MLIEKMPDVLTWRNVNEHLVQVYRGYLNLLCDALSHLISEGGDGDPIARQLHQQVQQTSDAGLIRVLMAPESSYRLLWTKSYPRAEKIQFLLNAFQAEDLREGLITDVPKEVWTALGDQAFYPDGRVFTAPTINDLMPLDFGSPHTKTVELGPQNKPGEYREPFTAQEIDRILAILVNTQQRLKATHPVLLEFSSQFNIVLILQKDPVDPTHFTSGSTGQYVGRSFFTNPHLPEVDTLHFAEGLVHEGIHGLLYMQERLKPWVHWPELLEPQPRIKSPWTGTILPVRQYMQACFVWYGLLEFWCLALQAQTFPTDRIRDRILKAFGGFTRGSLRQCLEPYAKGISEDLLIAIPAMQDVVLSVIKENAA
jgi:hypothetical protein